MLEIVKLVLGLIVLLLGFPIGNFLAKITKDEQKQGKKWFKLIIFVSLIGGIIGLIIQNDVLLFTFFFIAIVTNRSLVQK